MSKLWKSLPALVFAASMAWMTGCGVETEVQGVIALTAEQVIQGLERKPTLAELLDDGASLVAEEERIDRRLRLYPLGTAKALAYVLLAR